MKAAVVQDMGGLDAAEALAKAIRWMGEAAAAGAALVVFPEAFLGGYPKGQDFGVKIGSRSPEGRRAFEQYARGALEIPGPETAALGEAAQRHGLHVVIGVVERELATLYCTALAFGGDGALLGRHRKVTPTAMERLIWGAGDGSTCGVWPTPLGRIGAAICWESYHPLYRAALYAEGVQLYCAPTVDDRDVWIPTLRHVALEGRCFVLSACPFARRRDLPSPEGNPGDVLIRGGSCIVGPLGSILAGPVYDQACLLTAEIDLAEILQGKFDLDVAGHSARPDLFTLHVDRSPRVPMRPKP